MDVGEHYAPSTGYNDYFVQASNEYEVTGDAVASIEGLIAAVVYIARAAGVGDAYLKERLNVEWQHSGPAYAQACQKASLNPLEEQNG